MLGGTLLAAAAAGAPSFAPVFAHGGDAGTTSPELTVVGNNKLFGAGLNGEVAVVGDTAVVAAGIAPGGGVISGMYNPTYACRSTKDQIKVKLVDISNPAEPGVVGQIPVPSGVTVQDVAALHVSTPSFTGDLAAVALAVDSCSSPTSGGHHGSGTFEDRGVAYYDITDPNEAVLLGRYKADLKEFPTDVQKCDEPAPGQYLGPQDREGPPPIFGRQACSSSQHSVHLMQRGDGKVLSVSTEPFATASGCFLVDGVRRCFAGDLRVVDITDPANPVQLSSFPEADSTLYPTQGLTSRPSGFSKNGCRPFSAGRSAELYAGGTKSLLAYLDDGLRTVDLANPSAPTQMANIDPYPATDRRTEGNGGYATVAGAGESLALLSDTDWIAPDSSVRIDSINGTTDASSQGLTVGSSIACEAMFTLFDPENTAQVYRKAGSQVPPGAGSSERFVYVGRGCPATASTAEDPYLTVNGQPQDVAGKILVLDRGRSATQSKQIGAAACTFAAKALRAQSLGAIGTVFDATFFNEAFSPDGVPAGLDIPVMAMDRPAVTRLRNTLCPSTTGTGNGDCSSTADVRGAMVDQPGAWGGLRVLDLASSGQVGQYATPRSQMFPPPDLGVYSVHHAVADGNLAFVAWNSDGLRILDLSNPAAPVEVGHFVPPDTKDPTGSIPAKAYVVGVAVAGCNVVISDVNSGLYVLKNPGCPTP